MPPAKKTVAPKGTHGGAGRGGGKKKSPVNAAGHDAADAPKRKQTSLADLLGPQFAKKAKTADVDGGGIAAINWVYVQHDGGDADTNVPQQQQPNGRVQYDYDSERLAILIKQGPEVYYKDKENPLEEVPAEHPNAERAERHGGKLLIQIEDDEAMWVTCGHVRAVEAPGAGGGSGAAGGVAGDAEVAGGAARAATRDGATSATACAACAARASACATATDNASAASAAARACPQASRSSTRATTRRRVAGSRLPQCLAQ